MRFSTLATISVAILAFATANVSASRGRRLSRRSGGGGVVGNIVYNARYRDAEGAEGAEGAVGDAPKAESIRDDFRPGILRSAVRSAVKVAGSAVRGARVAGSAVRGTARVAGNTVVGPFDVTARGTPGNAAGNVVASPGGGLH